MFSHFPTFLIDSHWSLARSRSRTHASSHSNSHHTSTLKSMFAATNWLRNRTERQRENRKIHRISNINRHLCVFTSFHWLFIRFCFVFGRLSCSVLWPMILFICSARTPRHGWVLVTHLIYCVCCDIFILASLLHIIIWYLGVCVCARVLYFISVLIACTLCCVK